MTQTDDITGRRPSLMRRHRTLRYLAIYGVVAAASLIAGLQHLC